jgi:hypothetical protein
MNDLDTALRDMLRERAQDITTVPPRLLDLDAEPEPTGPRPNYWLIAAAVAAVLAVAAAITSFALLREKTPPPAKPVPVRVTRLQGCETTLPRVWVQAMKQASDAPAGTVLKVATDGSALVVPSNASREVDLDTATSHRALPLAVPTGLSPGAAAFSGNYAVIALTRTAIPLLERIDIVDLRSLRTVHSLHVGAVGGAASESMAVSNGRVYWDQRDSAQAKRGTIRSYDIATGRQQVVYSGPEVAPRASAAGVYWAAPNQPAAVHIPADDLPTALTHATTPVSRVTMVSDGTHYAWYDAADSRIGWFDGREIRYLPANKLPIVQHRPAEVAVAGPYVFYLDLARSHGGVVDIRSGAAGDLSGAAPGVASGGGSIDTLRPGPVIAGGGGTVAVGLTLIANGDRPLLRVDTATLPALRC